MLMPYRHSRWGGRRSRTGTKRLWEGRGPAPFDFINVAVFVSTTASLKFQLVVITSRACTVPPRFSVLNNVA